MELKLEAKTEEEKMIKEYLENNVSEVLAEKINSGKKTLKGCWNFITNEAKKYLNNKSGGIIDKVVFGWAIHYFEEDSIEEGKVNTSAPATKESKKKVESKPKEKKQPTIEDLSMNLFDFGLEVEEDTENENNNEIIEEEE